MDRSSGRPPLAHSRKKTRGMSDAKTLLRDCELNPVMAELRELKQDISELGRSLDGSTISFALRQKDRPRNKTASLATDLLSPTNVDGRFPSPGRNRSNQDYDNNDPIGGTPRRPCYAHVQGGSNQGSREHSSDCGSDYELEIRFPPAPPARAPVSAAAAAAAGGGATAGCRRGVQADYGGVQDVGQLVRRVEASTRAVSRESEDIAESLRMEEDKASRLRDALWQEGMAKRDWETATEASRVLKQRLGSTERCRKRQKEFIRELQAVEADIAFANAGGMAGLFSRGPLPLLSPPLPLPPPPSPPPLPTSAARRAKASTSSRWMLRRDHAAEGEEITKRKSSGRRAWEHQQGRQRRSRPARAHTTRTAAFGGHVRSEQEGNGGGGVEKRGLPVTVSKQKRVSSSHVMGWANGSTTAAGRCRAKSSSARRPRITSGDATAGASATAKRKQRGTGVCGGGGGDLGRRPRGASTSAACLTSGRTAENAARRARVDDRQKLAPAPPRSSLRLGVREPAGRKSAPPPSAGAAAPKRVRRRPALKARVASAAARLGAPTAASSGKDRRRDGAMAPDEQCSGATPREGGSRKSSPSSASRAMAARSSRHLVHSSLGGIATRSRPRSRTAAARKISSAVESARRRTRRG